MRNKQANCDKYVVLQNQFMENEWTKSLFKQGGLFSQRQYPKGSWKEWIRNSASSANDILKNQGKIRPDAL